MKTNTMLSLGTLTALVAVIALPCQAQEEPAGVAEESRPVPAVAEPPQPPVLPAPPPPPVGYQPLAPDPSSDGAYDPRAGWARPPIPYPADEDRRSEPRLESRWYGWQTLLVDGSALLLASDASVPVYVLGGPIVHWAHGNGWRGVGSLTLRVGAPALFAAALVSGCDGGGDMGCYGDALLGVVLGVVTAVAVDAAVLARDKVVVEDDASFSLGPARVTPAVSFTESQGKVMLAGTF